MTPLKIEGAWLIEPAVHRDLRGEFFELYRSDLFAQAVGHEFDLRQASMSVSSKGVVRGIHYSVPGQAKYAACVAGAILDVIVDIRPTSSTFGAHEVVELSGANRRAVYLSGDLGHGFCALTDDATMIYLQSRMYDTECERTISPLDSTLGIQWPTISTRLSNRDWTAPGLAEAMERGLLP